MAESRIVRSLRRRHTITCGNYDRLVGERELERDTARRLAEYRADAIKRIEEQNKSIISKFEAHILVLLGDRDALTRTLEVCTRRLASPTADRDPYRAGWRGVNQEPLNMKAEPER